jgi:hypothetical protein
MNRYSNTAGFIGDRQLMYIVLLTREAGSGFSFRNLIFLDNFTVSLFIILKI